MKDTYTTIRDLAVALTLFCSIGGESGAAVILNVDVSDPTAVVFSSTTEASMANFLNAGDSGDGVTLAGLFSGNTTVNQLLVPTSGVIEVLSDPSGNNRGSLQTLWIDEHEDGWTLNDVNIYDQGFSFTTSFLDSSPALQGTMIADLSSFSGIQSSGFIGTVFAGAPNANQVIGQFRIIPVPSALILGLGGLGLALPWRPKKSNTRMNTQAGHAPPSLR